MKLTDEDIIKAAKAWLAKPDIGVTQIAHRLGVSLASLYRCIPAAQTAQLPVSENSAYRSGVLKSLIQDTSPDT